MVEGRLLYRGDVPVGLVLRCTQFPRIVEEVREAVVSGIG